MDRSVHLLYEVGALRQLKRTWSQFLGVDTANIAEHTFRVMWIALLLCAEEKKGDSGKVAKMALVHDLGESRTGDANMVQSVYVRRDEEEAVRDMLADTALAEEMQALWCEYEERKSIEAQLVKDADHLDCEFELGESSSRGGQAEAALRADRDRQVFPSLHTEAARRLWQARMQARATDWWARGKSRFNPKGYEGRRN